MRAVMTLIECKNVSFSYEGSPVLREINFSVDAGDYLCIVGENGTGKSTLLRGLLHLKNPSDGKIDFGGGLKSTHIGYLPQQTAAQKDFPASVYEVVLSGRLNSLCWRPFFSARDKAVAAEKMKLLNIDSLKNQCYRNLSGGQQQRVLLARALCATKKLLLLDEPVTGLDPVISSELYKIIKDINRTQGITIIMVSHDVCGAIDEANKVLHLGDQSHLFFGTPSDYLQTSFGQYFAKGKVCACG